VIDETTTILASFKKSKSRRSQLRKNQLDDEKNPVETPLQLIKPNSTRWNSTFYACRRILRLQQHIEEMARALAQVDPQSPIWASLRESGLRVEVLGWKFGISVQPDKLVLTEAAPVPPQVAENA